MSGEWLLNINSPDLVLDRSGADNQIVHWKEIAYLAFNASLPDDIDDFLLADITLKLSFLSKTFHKSFIEITKVVYEKVENKTLVPMYCLVNDGTSPKLTLEDIIQNPVSSPISRHLDEAVVDIIETLSFLHQEGIVHGNIKASMIYFCVERGRFCLSSVDVLKKMFQSVKGTSSPCSAVDDIFAFGALIRVLASSQIPLLSPEMSTILMYLADDCQAENESNRPSIARISKLVVKVAWDLITTQQKMAEMNKNLILEKEKNQKLEKELNLSRVGSNGIRVNTSKSSVGPSIDRPRSVSNASNPSESTQQPIASANQRWKPGNNSQGNIAHV